MSYILSIDTRFIDDLRGLYHYAFRVRYPNGRTMKGDDDLAQRLYPELNEWCEENLPYNDYVLTRTIANGIRIAFLCEESAMAFKLRWG